MNEGLANNLLEGCREASAAVTAADSRAAEIHICKGSCLGNCCIFLTNSTHDLAITFSGVPPEQQVAFHWVRTAQTCGKACAAKPSLRGVPGDV